MADEFEKMWPGKELCEIHVDAISPEFYSGERVDTVTSEMVARAKLYVSRYSNDELGRQFRRLDRDALNLVQARHLASASIEDGKRRGFDPRLADLGRFLLENGALFPREVEMCQMYPVVLPPSVTLANSYGLDVQAGKRADPYILHRRVGQEGFVFISGGFDVPTVSHDLFRKSVFSRFPRARVACMVSRDSEIERTRVGDNRPIFSLDQRATMLKLAGVDLTIDGPNFPAGFSMNNVWMPLIPARYSIVDAIPARLEGPNRIAYPDYRTSSLVLKWVSWDTVLDGYWEEHVDKIPFPIENPAEVLSDIRLKRWYASYFNPSNYYCVSAVDEYKDVKRVCAMLMGFVFVVIDHPLSTKEGIHSSQIVEKFDLRPTFTKLVLDGRAVLIGHE